MGFKVKPSQLGASSLYLVVCNISLPQHLEASRLKVKPLIHFTWKPI